MRARSRGFGMIFVLVVVAWVGAAMYVLTDVCATMDFATREILVSARGRNMAASALAWARLAGRDGRLPERDRQLDASALGGADDTLSVSVAATGPGLHEATIRTQCRNGRVYRKRETRFAVAVDD